MRMLKLLVACSVAFGSFTAMAEEIDSISREITEGKVLAAQFANLEYEYQQIVSITESIGMNSTEDSGVMTGVSQLELEAKRIFDEAMVRADQSLMDEAAERIAEIKRDLLKIQFLLNQK